MDNSTRGNLPAYNEKKQDDRKKWVKFAFITAAVTLGTYYGAGRYVKVNTKKIEALGNSVNAIGQFMADQTNNRAAFEEAQRQAIVTARAAGKGFTYYPGLGVLHHVDGQ